MRFFGLNIERRSVSYTDAVISAMERATLGKKTACLMAIQACSNAWGFGLASSAVASDSDRVTSAISPDFLEAVGRDLLLCGESLWLIRAGGTKFIRVSDHTVEGTYDPNTWKYRPTMPGPTGGNQQLKKLEPARGILHFRINQEKEYPWKGVSPIMSCKDLDILGALRTAIQSELQIKPERFQVTSGVVKSKAKLEKETHDDKVKEDVEKNLLGYSSSKKINASDLKVVTSDPNLQGPMVQLLSELKAEISSACSVPPGLVVPQTSGTASREDIRRFFSMAMQPVGLKIQRELRDKVDKSIKIDPSVIMREGDIGNRARAFSDLVKNGMDADEAMAKTGILDIDQQD